MRSNVVKAAAATATLAIVLAGCGTTNSPGARQGGGGTGQVGATVPLLTSPFWQAYNNYVPKMAAEGGVQALPTVNANSDPAKLITDMTNLLNQGVKGLVVTPLDSAAVVAGLAQAERKGVPVVAVDVAPESGKVAMVVRADNRAYGVKACEHIGEKVKQGKVVQIQGDLASVNGRDRSEAFRECMTSKFPQVQVLDLPAEWKAEKASSGLESLLTANPDVKGVYMQAGGVYLAPTLQALRRKDLLHPVGDPRHVVAVSNDGIPQEFEAIRKGELDATVSQPADAYAKYGMYWIKKAMAGETFKAGPTDHGSTVVEVRPGILEDQLPAPLVTKDNVEDKALWGNQL
ncbi:simple sugar transport system substrate-binding protein/ribose transport system substrate-binding protein [Crossiella equi]|uniref:Simple sugar transport system substrate-binding protein/ribose transport system substrate-binding protein n=1 Tax=Crossiella equi TaxID=130796 RepID=A0ABS5AHE4_9PSEU|nr:sugar ABC transporter substrate-binding protein [Crossiella equi]MBP2475105.1 simple sugar transport system substrate-binding protein/ribose transport system substrate-binding protein [Crossiella equi]